MANGTNWQPTVLTSWKEIAAYLGKGVRTVQRWEAEFGLPVRRPNERAKGIVHATREDLDRWLASNWSSRLPEESDRPLPTFQPPVITRMQLESSRDLRRKHSRLVAEFRASLDKFRGQCEKMRVNLQLPTMKQ